MALQPLPPVPNTRLVDDPARDGIWRRWLEQFVARVLPLNTGTVTSVGLSLPTSVFDVSGSPVTTSGTLAATFDTQSANTVFAGPTTGAAATPAFRALVPADIPTNTPLTIGTTPIVSGTAGRVLFEGTGNVLQEDSGLAYDAATDTLTIGAVISLPDGSSTEPSVKIGDEQNGFYSPATNQVGITLAGAQRGLFTTTRFRWVRNASGADLRVTSENTNSGAGSSSGFDAEVAAGTSGDPYSTFTVTGVVTWSYGLDNSDSDTFKISRNATLGTNDFFALNTSGAVGFNSSFGTSGQVLTSAGTGAPPTWTTPTTGTVTSVAQTFTGGLISVSGSPITTSGTLALTVAGTSGGIPYFSGAATWASSAALAANALVIGGGAGAAPATTTTGTGVVTALGVAVGSAGAFVVNGGALGTPSSGTVTNLTGTASININGTVGATTPAAGTFTTLTANGNTTLGDAAGDTLTVNAETISQPNIPCFLAYNSATDSNQTGNGATVTVEFDTEVFDQSGDYDATTDTFTAPATGRYSFEVCVRLQSIPAGVTSISLTLVTSNFVYRARPIFAAGTFSGHSSTLAVTAEMDAGDTAQVQITAAGGAGDTAGITGGSGTLETFFSGRRVA